MENYIKLTESGFSIDDLVKIRHDLEKYINIIDENVITSKTDLKGYITYTSKAFEQISGYSNNELLGKKHNIIRHPDMPASLFQNLWETLSLGKSWDGEIKNLRKDGSFYWVKVKITPSYDYDGNHIGYTSIRQDITDKKKMEEIAVTDELTKLYNRRFYNQMICKEINRHMRDRKIFSFIIFDVDHFKLYNDNYGHPKGDEVLAKIGSFINKKLRRSGDYSFRLGGEEFGIFYTTDTPQNSVELAKSVCKGIEDLKLEHNFSSVSKYVTVSLGVTVCNYQNAMNNFIDQEKLYEFSDQALYHAKTHGRNQVEVVYVN